MPPKTPLLSTHLAADGLSWVSARAVIQVEAFGRPLETRQAQTTARAIDLLRRAFHGDALLAGPHQCLSPGTHLGRQALAGCDVGTKCQARRRQRARAHACRSALGAKPSGELQLPLVEAYLQALSAGDQPPQRIGLSRSIYPAADKQTALAAIRAEVLRNAESLVAQGQLPAGLSLEEYCTRLNIAYRPSRRSGGHAARPSRILPYATD